MLRAAFVVSLFPSLLLGASVVAFSPRGTVKDVTQVAATFDEPMVRFGDPRVPPPFDVKCPVEGVGRWVDTKRWVYDFPKALPAGVECIFTARDDVKAGEREFRFSTGGPSVRRSHPYEGGLVDEDEVFILTLDAEPDESSVTDLVHFRVDGIQEKVGVRIVTGSDRKNILKASWTRDKESPLVLVQARQRFPEGAKVSLVWAKGVKSKTGVATEQDQVLAFEARKLFTVEFSCERENAQAACLPIGWLGLRFSAPVATADAEKAVLRDSDGRALKPEPAKDSDGTTYNVTFKGPFRESADYTVELPKGLEDDAGRKPTNADKFPLAVKTDRYPPLAKFSAQFGILESKGAPMLPVTIRNLEIDVKSRLFKVAKSAGKLESFQESLKTLKGKTFKAAKGDVLYWIRRVEHAHREYSVFGPGKPRKPMRYDETDDEDEPPPRIAPVAKAFSLPRRESPRAFEVVGVPMNDPGFYVVELESDALGHALLGKPQPMYVPTTVLVTNLGVHFKWGRESSIAWVTTLDSAQPVQGAMVEVRDCRGTVLAKETTDALGVAHFDGLRKDVASCKEKGIYDQTLNGVLVTAERAGDLSFVHSSWQNGIEHWRFNLPTDWQGSPHLAHTVFDRTLFRAGETAHMKHYLRRHTGKGIDFFPEKDLPGTLRISHQGSEQSYQFPLKWDGAGIAETDWAIPKEAKLGVYDVYFLTDPKVKYGGWYAGQFRVEEFRIPLMRGTLAPPAEPAVGVTSLPLDATVSYLAGGGASALPVKLRAVVQEPLGVGFPDFEDFTFANGTVPEGRVRRGAEREADEEDGAAPRREAVRTESGVLDKVGAARLTVKDLPRRPATYEVLAELEYRDPNGESQTLSTRVPIYPAKRLAGIKLDSWASSQDALRFHVAVVDVKGKAVAGAPVSVEILEKKTVSHRKRILGGYYAYEHYEEVKRLGGFCQGETNQKGILICEGKAPGSGNLIVQARTKDADGNETGANREAWVAGESDWWFPVANHDRMDVLPEKKRYEPGQTAKFQVRMPFRDATALVTVEREGILETYVQKINGKASFVEIPVKPHYAPNVFVSVLALRGRSGEVQPTALVDLGRPSFKLGVGEIKVGWQAHELKVKVAADKSIYRVRQKARVKLAVMGFDGRTPAANADVAVAAVDEGLLELKPNRSWDILQAMMGQRPYEVDTATAQMHVIGRRHFGLKALPSGGGGGNQATRELFDTLLLWKARVKTDAKGTATVDIPLNDSITSFRIVAVASQAAGRFGQGSTSVRTTQDLMLFAGVPPLLRSGDKAEVSFTVRNATDKPMEVEAGGKVDGLPEPLKSVAAKLAGGEAKEITWAVTVPQDVSTLGFELSARAKGGPADRIRVKAKVVSTVPVRPYQATIEPLDKEVRIPAERPKDALAGLGGIKVSLEPTLLTGVGGIRDYMTAYPYGCYEQETSRAVALRDPAKWQTLMRRLPAYLDGDGLIKYFPPMELGSDVLTSYVLSIAGAAGWEIPEPHRSRLLRALKGFVEGSVQRGSALPTADLAIRKIAAIEALSRYPRGGAKPEQLGAITIEPNLWPTSAVIDWWSILRRMDRIPQRNERLAEAETILRSRLAMQGTTMGFSTEKQDRLWWLMVSTDVNAVRFLNEAVAVPSFESEIARLVRGTLGRQRHGHWDLTTANAWGVLALERFAAKFEKTPVEGRSVVSFGPKSDEKQWRSSAQLAGPFFFPWPAGKEEVTAKHQGAGRPWVIFQALAALPLKEPLWAGYRIEKSIQPIERKDSSRWSRGDIARVTLKLTSQSDMTWVVVEDPIPAGASVLGSGLGRDSAIATSGEKRTGHAWPAFEERSFEAFRSYYEVVRKGEWSVEYTLRLNGAGTFQLPTTRVEAMYAPEMFGEMPNAAWEIGG